MHFLVAQCSESFAQYSNIFLTLFFAGLVGGFTHCAGMCGPFVIAQVSSKNNEEDTILKRASGYTLIPYHLGRTSTYVSLAILSSLLSKQIMVGASAQLISVTFLTLAGIVFIIGAFPKKIQILGQWKFFGLSEIISNIARPFMKNPRGVRGYLLGVLLGFLPCGLIFAALMVTATVKDPFSAALAMSFFAIATIPSLLLVSGTGVIFFGKWPKLTKNIIRTVMVFNGMTLIALAAKIIW